jgi:hypothetical protein
VPDNTFCSTETLYTHPHPTGKQPLHQPLFLARQGVAFLLKQNSTSWSQVWSTAGIWEMSSSLKDGSCVIDGTPHFNRTQQKTLL